MMKNTTLLGILAVLVLEAGCMMGPKYKRPTVDVPQEYRAPAPERASQASSLGNEQWWQVYQDPVLTQLIHTAIAQNYDVRIAAARVLEAQAQVGITRANQLPSASVGADVFSQQNAKVSNLFPAYQVNGGELNLSVIWNLDFWGKYRRQTEAARAQLLATEWGQRAVISSLVANVATAYFQLRALDNELDISKRTLASRQQSLKLTQFLESHGGASGLDVSQAEQLVYTASETIPDLERQIQQQENVLSVLLGENPQSIPRGRALTEQPVPQNVPAGLPSELLERRPDVRQAEENVVAANAQIGAAKAAFFPNLSLTGLGGLESNALHQFITAPSEMWYGAFSVSQPVFQGGALRSQLRLARASWQETVFSYQQTVQNALEQVSNSVVASQKDREFREQQELLTQAAQQTDQFSEVLYKNGGASYLQVLTSETNYFSAELNLVQAQLNERLALVQLYQALGGGWQQ
ncbi:MAG TPA: efflux transporter outer membrane subunit [Terriglobales bacterium]|jgi:multidrug efflux system outer membrane protein|nr:efflux transporter outer membrane subunit [Terriglobales bacterium]